MIEFKRVTFAYPNGFKALDNLTLSIKKGERAAIIGNNGSGKTTLALMVNGILKPSAGEVRIDGLNPAEPADSRLLKRKVGLVFQNPDNQLVAIDVEREVAFSLENRNIPQAEISRRVGATLAFLGLSDFRKRLTGELSGGEKQKVALAAVMISEPEILVLDEPGSYLDESGKKLLNDALKDLMRQHPDLTIIRITQYSHVAEDYPRVIAFHKGKVAMDGAPEEIFGQIKRCRELGIEAPLKYRIRTGISFPDDGCRKMSGVKKGEKESCAIKAEAVSFSYGLPGEDGVFKGLNLLLENNAVYGLVGQSGSGKSTLIQLLSGLLKPDRGKIEYINFRPQPGDLAVCFQHPERQFFLTTVDREIKFGAENHHLPDIDEAAGKAYDLIGLPREEFAARDPFTLSGGEKRRLAFGTALTLRPRFVFFDEPTCGLDYDGIRQFKKMVQDLHERGVGILIVSHHGEVIFDLCDRIFFLEKRSEISLETREQFFGSSGWSAFLSSPSLVAFQRERFGSVRYFSERELADNLIAPQPDLFNP